MKLKELKGSEFGAESAGFQSPEGSQYPGPFVGGRVNAVALEWRPTFIFDTDTQSEFVPDALTVSPIFPVSFAVVSETSSYTSTEDGSITRYSLQSRFQGPQLNVGARYQVAPEFFGERADIQVGASVTAGMNAYGNLIEESTVSGGVASRSFSYEPGINSFDVAAQGEFQINAVTLRGGVTWDSCLGAAPLVGVSLNMNAYGDWLRRAFIKDK